MNNTTIFPRTHLITTFTARLTARIAKGRVYTDEATITVVSA